MTSPYHYILGKWGIEAPAIIISDNLPDGFVSKDLWDKWAKQSDTALLQRGGNGRPSIMAIDAIPTKYRTQIVARHGDPQGDSHPMATYWSMSAEARKWYTGYRHADNTALRPEQIDRYTINASVLDALRQLESARLTSRKARGGSKKGVWTSLHEDCQSFAAWLHKRHGWRHSLPTNERRLKSVYKEYQRVGFAGIIDGRAKNSNAAVVTPMMLSLWRSIFAGQKGRKPSYVDVYSRYTAFLAGTLEVINGDTGEVYEPSHADFRPASQSTIYLYQSQWSETISTHLVRGGNRQQYMGKYQPFHKLLQPEYAGSIISVDDRQPPFAYAVGKRPWFYNAIDLGSEAFTCWVHGESKEGIILDFYRQLARNYHEWGLNLPHELEGEMSLNSSYVNSFLTNGAMFNRVRIEANNARGKRIERFYGSLRYEVEKDREGWLARPHALSERNQPMTDKAMFVPYQEIIDGCLRDIARWNNSLHSRQDLYPNKTRWDLFMDNQHPDLTPTNWHGILPHLGHTTRTSMRNGRITLQGMHRVVGIAGQVALGEDLIRIMDAIEGEEVTVHWLDGNDGKVIKAVVCDYSGAIVCDLLDDLAYHRASIERGEDDLRNRELMSAYVATVTGYARRGAQAIEPVVLIDKPQPRSQRFVIAGYQPIAHIEEYTTFEMLPDADELNAIQTPVNTPFRTDTKSRF